MHELVHLHVFVKFLLASIEQVEKEVVSSRVLIAETPQEKQLYFLRNRNLLLDFDCLSPFLLLRGLSENFVNCVENKAVVRQGSDYERKDCY